jgi:hypothetical protein
VVDEALGDSTLFGTKRRVEFRLLHALDPAACCQLYLRNDGIEQDDAWHDWIAWKVAFKRGMPSGYPNFEFESSHEDILPRAQAP